MIEMKARRMCGCLDCQGMEDVEGEGCQRQHYVQGLCAGRDLAIIELQHCLDEMTVSLAGAIGRVRALR